MQVLNEIIEKWEKMAVEGNPYWRYLNYLRVPMLSAETLGILVKGMRRGYAQTHNPEYQDTIADVERIIEELTLTHEALDSLERYIDSL